MFLNQSAGTYPVPPKRIGGDGSFTNPAFDPIEKIPEFRFCAVKIKKVSPESDRSTA